MANRSNHFSLDSSSLEEKPNLEKDIGFSASEKKKGLLPDISDVQNLFNKNRANNTDISNSIDRNKEDQVRSEPLVKNRANDEKNEDIESKEFDIEKSPKGREIVLYLDQVLADPKDNISRSGRIYHATDHEVVTLAHMIKTKGLINPVEVSKLDEPIERENPTEYASFYTHKVNSGFKRFYSLKLLGFKQYRFTIFDNISEDDILIHNGIENFGRSDPTDYDLALYIALLNRKRNWSAHRIAIEIGGKIGKVESLLLIATKLPNELLDVFKMNPTPEIRRDLSKISLIERETKEETHRAMMAEWIRLQNEKTVIKETVSNIPKHVNKNINQFKESKSGQVRFAEIRNEQSSANQWFDSSNNTYRPITKEMREYGDALIRYISDRKLRSIFK